MTYFNRILLWSILLTAILVGCASLSTYKPEEAFLDKAKRTEFAKVVRSGNRGQLSSFIESHSKNIKFFDGLVYKYIQGFVWDDIYAKEYQSQVYLIFSNDGVYYGTEKVSASVFEYLGSFIDSSQQCYSMGKPMRSCSLAFQVPDELKAFYPARLICKGESCFLSLDTNETYQLKLHSAEKIASMLPPYISSSAKMDFANALIERVKKENGKNLAQQKKKKEYAALENRLERLKKQYRQMNCDFLLESKVVQKLDASSYELAVGCFPGLGGKCMYGPVSNVRSDRDIKSIIYTPLKKNSLRQGLIGQLDVKKVGQKKVTLKNGFSETVDIFVESKECESLRHKQTKH